MSAVVIDGGLVHYEAFGRGKPVLFLHGWLGSWRYWMSTMEAISDKNRTFAIDLWGFGDSDKSKMRYKIHDYVSLINKFVENRGMSDSPVTIVGHALGAIVMIEYAAMYPNRVDKLLSVSLPMSSTCINEKMLGQNTGSVVSKMLSWRQNSTPEEVQKEAEKTESEAINSSLASLKDIEREQNFFSRIADIGENGGVVLAVYGEKDEIIDNNPIRDLDNRWANIRPIALSESKHFPMLDEASKFQRLLKDFLEVDTDLSALELKEEWRRRTR